MSKKLKEKTLVKEKRKGDGEEKYILQLFITGILPNSLRAVENINIICEQYLKGRVKLEVIDIYQQPALAVKEDIIAVPLLIKKFPLPERRMIGDLSDIKTVLKALNIIAPN